jgi:hypothetical protein
VVGTNASDDPSEAFSPVSGAPSYARVARSDSTPFSEERASATRLRAGELQSRIPNAPDFRYGPLSSEELNDVVRRFEEITGKPVRPGRQRNLVAACYRVHGPDFIPFAESYLRVERSDTNLLAVIRGTPPRLPEDVPEIEAGDGAYPAVNAGAVDGHDGPPCPLVDCLPGLTYCANDRPPFDPASRHRHDRRPSNPDAALYFPNQTQTAEFDASSAARVGAR